MSSSRRRRSRTGRAASKAATGLLLGKLLSIFGLKSALLPPAWITTIILVLLSSYLGCDPSSNGDLPSPWNQSDRNWGTYSNWNGNEQTFGGHPQVETGQPTPAIAGRREAIIIGAFNIQTFGQAKMNQPDVVPILVDIVRRFDILAIQELRDRSKETIPDFLRLINADGSQFRAAVSPRISYQNSTYAEQLVFIYDAEQIELIGQPYVADDPLEQMYRPPYVAHFRCRAYPTETAFSCVLMNVHTSPSRTAIEFTALESIIPQIRRNHPQEDDFILLGDLNEEPGGFLTFRWFDNQTVAIPSRWKTNTRMTKNYDNLVFDALRTSEFLRQAGVMNIMDEYQLTLEQALRVSDHLPVWALFSTRENRPVVDMTQDSQTIR